MALHGNLPDLSALLARQIKVAAAEDIGRVDIKRVDIKTRRWEAIRALESLELQIEQYRLHIKELSAHPTERVRAEAELKKLLDDCAVQRTYCDLLAQEQQAVTRKNGLHAA
jgi:hypothetical protein